MKNSSAILFVIVMLIVCSGCGGSAQTASTVNDANSLTVLADRLPALPGDTERVGSTVVPASKAGSDTFQQSDGVSAAVNDLVMFALPGALLWGMYQFSIPEPFEPRQVSAGITASNGNEVWIGVSNYSQGRWDFFGPTGQTFTYGLNLTDRYTTETGMLYVILVAFDDNDALINQVSVHYEDQLDSISGTVLLTDEDPPMPLQGVLVTAKSGEQSWQDQTDINGEYRITGLLPAEYEVTTALDPWIFTPCERFVTIVDGDVTGVDFDASIGTDIDYLNDVSGHFEEQCLGCHGDTSPAAGLSFTAFWRVEENAATIKTKAVDQDHGGWCENGKSAFETWFNNDMPYGLDVTYTEHTADIFSNCIGCHGGGSPTAGLDLDSYADILANSPELIWGRVKTNSMPPGSNTKLTDVQKDILKAWFNQERPE